MAIDATDDETETRPTQGAHQERVQVAEVPQSRIAESRRFFYCFLFLILY